MPETIHILVLFSQRVLLHGRLIIIIIVYLFHLDHGVDTTTITQILTSTTNYDFVRVTDAEGCYTDLFDNFDVVVNPLPIASLDAENRYICDNPNSKATLKFEVYSGNLPYKLYYKVNLDNTQIPDSVGNLHTLDTNVTGKL